MPAITPKDARKNQALAEAMVEQETPQIAGQVGLHALAELADLLPHEEFAEFLNNAVQQATTGQAPPEEDKQQESQSPQGNNGTPTQPS